eukprot:6491621-Amphidinium_carterae.1
MSSLNEVLQTLGGCGKTIDAGGETWKELCSTSTLVEAPAAMPSVVTDSPEVEDVSEEIDDERDLFGSDNDSDDYEETAPFTGTNPESDVEGDGLDTESFEEELIRSPKLTEYWDMCTGSSQIPTHNFSTYVQHLRDGHIPKLRTCPVCQLADGPPYIHRRLERTEVGKLSIDISGPFSEDLFHFKYLMIGVFVAVHDDTKIESEANQASQGPKKRVTHKRRKELLLPFARLLKSREGSEVADSVKNMILDIESFVSPLLLSHLPTRPRVLNVVLNLPTSSDDSPDRVMSDLEAVVKPLLPTKPGSCVLRLHTDKAREFMSKEVADVLRDNHIFQTTTSAHSPASNGRAEVAIRVVKSVIRRLLLASKFPVFFWGFAGAHA